MKEARASCEGISANPFADQGAHCRPWTPASIFLQLIENKKLLDSGGYG
jgi:hypothetical protein